MTTLFDIGDEIEVTIKGRIEEFSVSKSGDCYVISLTNVKPEGSRIYLDSTALRDAALKGRRRWQD